MAQKKRQPDLKTSERPGERIAKVIARAGVCSRREAEKLIAQGRVEIDRKTVESPAEKVLSGQKVRIDGEALPGLEPIRLFRLYKPTGVITTEKDPEGRRTVFDLLPEGAPRLLTVGRLDINSEGLLLLTNDGGLKRYLELPATGWVRRYRVRVFGKVSETMLEELRRGVTVDGVNYGPMDAKLDNQSVSNAWITLGLREGKNREIRRVCEHLGLGVNRLLRVSYGPFQLGSLKEGEVEEVPPKVLRDQLGKVLDQLQSKA